MVQTPPPSRTPPPDQPAKHPPAPGLESYWPATGHADASRRPATAAGSLLRTTGTLLGGLLFLVGPPVALTVLVGWPLPQRWPTGDQIAGWFDQPRRFTAAGLIDVAACILWVLWAFLVIVLLYATAATVATATGRIRTTRIRLPGPLRTIAAGIAGAILVLIGSTTARAAPATTSSAALDVAPPGGAPAAPAQADHTATAEYTTGPAMGTTPVLCAGTHQLSINGQRYIYRVERDESLFAIAKTCLGDGNKWPQIWQANKHRHIPVVDRAFTNPHRIYPGQVLLLPHHATAPPTAIPADPQPREPADAANPPATSAGPSTPPPTAPTHDRNGDTNPQPGTTLAPTAGPTLPTPATGSTTVTTPATADPAPPTEHDEPDEGIDLPDGGWVAAPLAAAVTAAAAMAWIQRRRHYRPRPPANGLRTDPDLTPMPPTVAALHHARRQPDPGDDMDALDPDAIEATTVTTATLGQHAGHHLRLPDLPPLGVGFTGPGAHHAARGILTAALSAGGPWSPETEAVVTIPEPDLVTLLDTDATYQLDRLHRTADLHTALADLERELLHRARQADDDLLTTPDGAETTTALPPIVLITTAPEPGTANRLAAILAIGSRLAIAGVILGPWPSGTTWHINTDGTTRGTGQNDTGGPRLNVLPAAATSDILHLLTQARPANDDHPPAPPDPAPPPALSATTPTDQPPPAAPAKPPPPTTGAPEDADTSPPPEAQPPAPARKLSLTVLGTPRVELLEHDHRTDVRVRRSDGTQILIYLATNPAGATSDELMAALWPETRPRYARGRFHTTISELRHHLHDTLNADAILRTGDRYKLNADHITVDLWHLNAAVDHAATTVDPDQHLRALRQIIKHYTGPLADNQTWLWLTPYREATRRHVLDAYTYLADNEPDHRTALTLIQAAIRLDPYNENVYQRAMHLHAKLNNADGITRTLRALTERLAELEIRPSPATQQTATNLQAKIDARRSHSGNLTRHRSR